MLIESPTTTLWGKLAMLVARVSSNRQGSLKNSVYTFADHLGLPSCTPYHSNRQLPQPLPEAGDSLGVG